MQESWQTRLYRSWDWTELQVLEWALINPPFKQALVQRGGLSISLSAALSTGDIICSIFIHS